MGKKRRHKGKHREMVQDNQESCNECNNSFQSITNLIAVLIIIQFFCKALEEK